MDPIRKLLLKNRAWAAEKTRRNPAYFEKLAKAQKPTYLWIGCSDSRVSGDEITNSEGGNIFVHRNIANQVHDSDLNLMSVITYAVSVLKVSNVVVCGHYGCGGIRAAVDDNDDGIIDVWLQPVRDVQRRNEATLSQCRDEETKLDRLVELVVKEQAGKLAALPVIQRAWAERGAPSIHGMVFNMRDGLLSEIMAIDPGAGESIEQRVA